MSTHHSCTCIQCCNARTVPRELCDGCRAVQPGPHSQGCEATGTTPERLGPADGQTLRCAECGTLTVPIPTCPECGDEYVSERSEAAWAARQRRETDGQPWTTSPAVTRCRRGTAHCPRFHGQDDPGPCRESPLLPKVPR